MSHHMVISDCGFWNLDFKHYPIQAANSEMNLQTVYHLSGQMVDVERVKALTRILEEAGDKRAEKGHKILKEISK